MAGYSTTSGTSAIALVATTAKTILALVNSSTGLTRVTEFGVSFDGTSGTAVPTLIELGFCTTAGAGTSTGGTIVQIRGPTRTVQATSKIAFTAEPTTITVAKQWLVHPQSGIVLQFPLGREIEQIAASNLTILRVTAPATLNCRGYFEFEEG